jgi:integrase
MITFEDYPVFRKDVSKGTRITELRDIGVFFRNYMVDNEYVEEKVAWSRNFIPSITMGEDELDANPAINQWDFKIISKHLRGQFLSDSADDKRGYSRQMLFSLVHLLKTSGCRPIEMISLRRRDIEITNPMRWSESFDQWEDDYKLKIHIRKSKTSKKRDVLCRSNAGQHMLTFLKYQREYMDKYHPKTVVDSTSLIFGKPSEQMEKNFQYGWLSTMWRTLIYQPLKPQLKGNKFSERPYTLYSLRSTFIEECISDQLDVYLVARLCGNSVNIIQRYYDRHDILNRADEVQHIERGKKKPPEVQVVDLADV